MATRKGIPPPLEQYIYLPERRSSILLTGTLHCTATWLTARFAGAAVSQHPGDSSQAPGDENEGETAVVLASWMRDEKFWKAEIRRTTGLDIAKAGIQNRFAFVDCRKLRPPKSNSPPACSPPNLDHLPLPDAAKATIAKIATPKGPNFSYIQAPIEAAIAKLSTSPTGPRRILLILDQPDVLLAIGECEYTHLHFLQSRLSRQVHTTVLSLSSDLPLVSASPSNGSNPNPTPLEVDCAAFLIMKMHNALFTMACRELATGAAKDVSGVLRITRGGGVYSYDDEEEPVPIKDGEMLYYIAQDGGAKVFERGAMESG